MMQVAEHLTVIKKICKGMHFEDQQGAKTQFGWELGLRCDNG